MRLIAQPSSFTILALTEKSQMWMQNSPTEVSVWISVHVSFLFLFVFHWCSQFTLWNMEHKWQDKQNNMLDHLMEMLAHEKKGSSVELLIRLIY